MQYDAHVCTPNLISVLANVACKRQMMLDLDEMAADPRKAAVLGSSDVPVDTRVSLWATTVAGLQLLPLALVKVGNVATLYLSHELMPAFAAMAEGQNPLFPAELYVVKSDARHTELTAQPDASTHICFYVHARNTMMTIRCVPPRVETVDFTGFCGMLISLYLSYAPELASLDLSALSSLRELEVSVCPMLKWIHTADTLCELKLVGCDTLRLDECKLPATLHSLLIDDVSSSSMCLHMFTISAVFMAHNVRGIQSFPEFCAGPDLTITITGCTCTAALPDSAWQHVTALTIESTVIPTLDAPIIPPLLKSAAIASNTTECLPWWMAFCNATAKLAFVTLVTSRRCGTSANYRISPWLLRKKHPGVRLLCLLAAARDRGDPVSPAVAQRLRQLVYQAAHEDILYV